MDGPDPAMIDLVDPARALRGFGDQTSLFQDAQVLGDGGPGDGHGAGELTHGAGTACEALKDLSPCRIAEGRDRESSMCVSHGLL